MSSKKKIVLYSADRVLSSRQQARIIRDEAIAMLETANEFSSTSRRVGKRSAFKVIARSLESTRGLPFSIRKHKAITELSNYISLAKHNKINGLVAFNTDLLPISHPKSTRPSSMTASAILESQMLWVTDDPRITDPEAKALIASAMMSHPDSPEHIYSMKRIELLPQGTVPLEALIASYGDGNSRAAKSARAKLQRRDRKGRFAEMFGTFKVILGLRDGGRASATGRILGQNIFNPDLLDMELSDGRIAAIPISQGEQPKAMLDDTSDEARKSGFVRVSGANYDAKAPVVPEDNLTFIDAPSGFRLDKDYKGAGKKYTDEAFDVVIYDKPSKDTRDVIDNAIKRSRERELADPKQVKLGEDGKIWDENRKLFSVTRRDEQTPFVFSQNWNDSIEEIARIEKIDDSQERFGQGEDEENSPLADQLKGKPKKAKARIADEGAKTSEGFKYNVPEGSIELDPDFDYVPEGTEDDPSRLAETYDKSELMDGLVDGLEPVNATTPAVGLGRLSQDDKDEDLEVPVEAILSALKEQGSDGKSALAEAYDKINKNKENQNALKDSRKGEKKAKAAEPKDIADVFPEVATEPAKPEEEAPIEEPTEDIISEQTELSLAEKLDQMPALESLSKEEKQSIIDDNNNYSKYLPKNEDVAMPEGVYQPKESTEKDRTDAIDLASSLGENLTKEDLTDNLEDAIKNEGTAEFLSSDENGESSKVFISAEALRDALALRGEDANKIIKDIAERNTPATKESTPEEKPAKEKKKKAKKEEPAAPPTPPTEPPAEDPAAEEEKPKKTTNYKRVGNRTLIRAGKGKPFSDKEVKDFLTENGFVFSDTVERDGRTIPVKAETAIQTDEEFKAFMRELRDRFGIELEPRKETAFSPAQEPIDFDAPEPEMPVAEEAPTPAEEEKPTPSTKPLPSGPKITEDKSKIPNELPDILPEGWTKDGNRRAKNDDGSLLLLIDQSGNKYWVLVADGLGNGEAFNSPQEALDYYEKNIKGRESSVKPVDLDKLRKDNKQAESDAQKPEASYLLRGDRLELRAGEKDPFKNQEVKDFLDANGFDWNPDVKAETKSGMDEAKAKDFLRQLRGRFGIDLLPSEGQPPIDLESKDESVVVLKPEAAPAPPPPPPPGPPTGPAGSDDPFEKIDIEAQYLRIGDLLPSYFPIRGAEERVLKRREKDPNYEMKPVSEVLGVFRSRTPKRITVKIRDLITGEEKSFEVNERAKFFDVRRRRSASIVKSPENLTPGSLPNQAPTVAEDNKDFDEELKSDKEFKDLLEARKEIQKAIDEADLSKDSTPEEKRALREAYNELTRRIDAIVLGDERKLRDLIEKRRKVQKQIDDADSSNKATAEQKKELRDLYDRLTRQIDAIILGEDSEKEEGSDADAAVDTAFIDILDEESDPRDVALDRVLDNMRSMLKLSKGEKKDLRKRKKLLLKILYSTFGPSALRLDNRNRREVKNFLFELNKLSTEDLEYIGKGINEELGWEFFRNLKETVDRLDSFKRPTRPIITRIEKPSGITPAKLGDPINPQGIVTPDETQINGTPSFKPITNNVKVINVNTSELKPGDIFVDDHYTITGVKREGSKRVNVDGVTQMIPSYRLSGYYPNSVEQSSKLWSENHTVDVYRGSNTQPTMGDLKELNQPKAEEYGAVYEDGQQTKIKIRNRAIWAPKDKEAQKKFIEDYEAYDDERLRRKDLWSVPPVAPAKSINTVYTDTVVASDVKVGDIAFKEDKNGFKEFFVITKVLESKEEGKTSLEGHYVGHQTQIKEWNSGTTIDVIRGEKNLPASGDKPALDRADRTLANYKELEKERQSQIAEADKGYTPALSKSEEKIKITQLASKPQLPAFYGSAEKLLELGDGPEIMKALDEAGYVVFDFETIGKNVSNTVDPDAPIQIAASKYKNGEKVDSLNIFVNPGEPLGSYYYERDEAGNLLETLRPNRVKDSEGNPITDEWLATQPSVEEQLKKLFDFFGENPILVGQNNSFDINIAQRFAEKLGLDFNMGGAVDTVGIARAIQKTERSSFTFPENPENKDTVDINGSTWTFDLEKKTWKAPSNSLNALAERLGVETAGEDGFHDAAFDVDVTEKVLRKLLENFKIGDVTEGGTSSYNGKYAKWIESRDQREKDIAAIQGEKIMSGETSNIDEAIAAVKKVSEEKISIVENEEVVVAPTLYESKIYKDIITPDWVRDPENTVLVTNMKVRDVRLGDFMIGRDGSFSEVVGFADDEVDPVRNVKIIRTNIETGVTIDGRATHTRTDVGNGYTRYAKFSDVYRRVENVDKTAAEIKQDAPVKKSENRVPDFVQPTAPVRGQPLTPQQEATVLADAVDPIVSNQSSTALINDGTAIEELDIDQSTKDQVVSDTRKITSAHLSADGEQLVIGDMVLNIKKNIVGKVMTLPDNLSMGANYAKIKYEGVEERTPTNSKSLRIIRKAGIGADPSKPSTVKSLVKSDKISTRTEADVVEAIKTLQSQPLGEGVFNPPNLPNAEEFAPIWKQKEQERNAEVERVNFVKTSTSSLDAIKSNLPANLKSTSSLPNLKTGEISDVYFAFDKPTRRELATYADELKLSGPDDILVFSALENSIFRSNALATIKPDGSIEWHSAIKKQNNSLELKKALDPDLIPGTNILAMAYNFNDNDDINEATDTVLGRSEAKYDYSRVSKNISPTLEQRAIVDAIIAGDGNVVVRALAGTGKTSTLKLAAKRLFDQKPDKKILYAVFNKSAQESASGGEFPKNTIVRTADALGVNNINPLLNAKKTKEYRKQNFKQPSDLAKALGYKETFVTVQGKEKSLSPLVTLGLIRRQVIPSFLVSADDAISAKHFAGTKIDTVTPELLKYAQDAWKDISSPTGLIPIGPKEVTKLWALSKPDLSKGIVFKDEKTKKEFTYTPDIIFYDEAQDMNPVMAKVMKDQKNIQFVYVGDSNQAIYGFNGAIDELDNIKAKYDLPITQTFRFGPAIAGIANRFLTFLDSPNRILGKPEKEGEEGTVVDFMEDPTVILTYTNAGGFKALVKMLAANKVVGIGEKTWENFDHMIDSISKLKFAASTGKAANTSLLHSDFSSFSSWDQVEAAVENGEGLGSANFMYWLVRNEGTTVVKNLLNSVSVIFPKKEPTGDFKPLTLDNVADKTTKNLGLVSKRGVNFPVNISYAVEGNELRIYEAQKYRRFLTDFEFFGAKNDDKGVRIENPKNFSNFKEFESKEEMLKVLNSLKKQVEGYDDNLGIDVEISTAHKYKGGQSPRVLIWDDFPVPQPDMQNPGQIKFPSKEDVNLAYVAITRAMESIELGSLAWILDYTKEEDESPRLLPEEEIFAMKIPTDPVAISEEEAIQQVQETIKNDDNRSDMVADAIIAAMEKGSVAWRDYVVGGSGFLPMNGIGGNEYRGSNMLYLAAVAAQKGYKDNRWMTFKQAKDNGGFVKKGEKSTKIIFVRKGYREVNRPDGTTEKKMFYTPPKVFDVFNVEQTEGVNLPANVVREPVDVSEGETLLMNAYKNGPAVIFEPRKVAGYSSSDDTVKLPMRDQFVSAQDLFETLAHEFAHSTGSASRLDRTDLTDKYKTHLDSRGEEELIAEISVSMIASRLGVKMDFENSVAYIASWLPALKNDKSIIVRAARKAQAAVDLILGKEGDEESQEVTPDSPVGEGVGREGRTGEDIAQDNLVEDAGLKPEPNLGEQGRSGEEISREVESDKSPYETPKNIDPDTATSKVTYNGKISDSWENFVFQDGPKAQDNLGIEGGVGAAAKRILEVDDFIVDRDEIGTYVSDIFKKYGYGDKAFVLHDAKDSDKILKKNGIEAGVTRAMTDTIPENHPFYKKPIPMLLIKSKGAKPVALLHEIAHMMSGNWIQGGGGGHSQDWYATYLALLDGEGYTREANLLRFTVYKPEEGDNGAIVKRG